MPNTFLLKSEPTTYSIDDLQRDGKTAWDGVRNHAAKLVLQAMKVGDEAFVYHSGDEKQVVGVARCVGPARLDPSDETHTFVCVDLQFTRKLKRPVPLKAFKEAGWDEFPLVRQSRLSCMHCPADVKAWILAEEQAPGSGARPAKSSVAKTAKPTARPKATATAAPAKAASKTGAAMAAPKAVAKAASAKAGKATAAKAKPATPTKARTAAAPRNAPAAKAKAASKK